MSERDIFSSRERTYIMSIVDELCDIRSRCMVSDKFDEPATRPTRCRTSVRKGGVSLLGVDERGAEGLEWIR